MKYRGIQQQIALNNTKSILYLLAFPLLLLAGTYIVLWIITLKDFDRANAEFISVAPLVVVGVAIWFVISYFFNTQMIQAATHSQPLQRRDNMRVYNLTENLCMSVGMTMPKLYIIESEALNAFASGINQQTYAVTLTRGIINRLTDEELEGVIAHELTYRYYCVCGYLCRYCRYSFPQCYQLLFFLFQKKRRQRGRCPYNGGSNYCGSRCLFPVDTL